MAGIGFKLQHLITHQKVGNSSKAYLSSALISTGPWILMALGISALAGGQLWFGSESEPSFRALVTHAFAFSQIIAGALQLGVSRLAADRLYEQDDQSLFPLWLSSSWICTLACMLWGAIGWAVFHLNAPDGLGLVLLMGLLGLLWNSSSFLSTLRDYRAILWAYLLGAAACIAYAALRQEIQLPSALWGLNFGIGLCLLLLIRRILIEFDLSTAYGWEIVQILKAYPALMAMGLFYGLGIWIDKFLFWWFPQTGLEIATGLYQFPLYDSPVFWALISVIPSYALFLLHTETDFYREYRSFYGSITQKASFREIHAYKLKMIRVVHLNAKKLLWSQGTVSGLFLCIPMINPKILGLSPNNVHIFQILVLATFLQVLFLFVNILLQYLDFLWLSAKLNGLFALLNLLLSSISILWGGVSWYGYGIFCAALICLGVAWLYLSQIMQKLEFHTFMGPKSRL